MSNNQYSASLLLNKQVTNFLVNRLKWTKLNSIQEKAIPIILDKEDTLIIAPTASGKTEAALLPIFSEIITKRFEPMSVLYVAPLKALINDMHNRIDNWANYFHLTATKWHGDVIKSKKDSFIKNPTDFLSITPESLEVILMNRKDEDKKRMFKNIKYVVVDEIHYFAESDRGIQLNSLLNRISKYIDGDIVKIGLSATVGNPESVAKWLNYKVPVNIIKDSNNRKFQYKVYNDPQAFDDPKILSKYLKNYTNKKILIFALSRADVEKYYIALKKELKLKYIYLHHSSLDKNIREENEAKFKNFPNGIMISTNTLELGIDIGDIDIILQLDPPNNVSSFLQRIGRSGRRSNKQRSIIITALWGVFFTLSIISLIKENKIEKIKIPTKSKDIYFHQILSSVFEDGKIINKDLFKKLKDAYVFSDISKAEFIRMINIMEELSFIDDHDNYLSLGYNFEKKFGKNNFMNFFSVFCPNFEYKIKEGDKTVGSVDASFALILKKGESFILGGKYWFVLDINYEKFLVNVKKDYNRKGDVPSWHSEGPPMNYLISRKVFDILTDEHDYLKFLENFDENSQNIVKNAQSLANVNGFRKGMIPFEINGNQIYIYSFGGDKLNYLLSTLFAIHFEIYDRNDTPFYSSFRIRKEFTYDTIINILYDIENILNEKKALNELNRITGKFYKNKFINFLPFEDQVKLKMNLLFDEENLINLVKNNNFEEVDNVGLDKWFKKEIPSNH